MSDPIDDLTVDLQATVSALDAWAAAVTRWVQEAAAAYAGVRHLPRRKGRIVTRAHTRTHWGQHG